MAEKTDIKALQKWLRAERERRGWSTTEVADRARAFAHEAGSGLKLTQQSVSGFETGNPMRIPEWMRYVEMAFNAADEETKEDPAPDTTREDSFVMIERLPTRAGAGGGGTGEGDIEYAAFSRNLVADLRARSEDLLLIEIEGDSMSPEFLSGDQMLVNKRKTTLAQPGAFCLWDGDGYVVKYLEKLPGTDPALIRVISGNPRYTAHDRLADELMIMGRVVWFARRV